MRLARYCRIVENHGPRLAHVAGELYIVHIRYRDDKWGRAEVSSANFGVIVSLFDDEGRRRRFRRCVQVTFDRRPVPLSQQKR